jgi:alanine racemase
LKEATLIYLEHLLEATHGTLRYQGKQTHFDAFSHDSRQIVPGELFVAVHGERSDGHDYLTDAVHRGATGLLVEARVINALPQETLAMLAHTTTIVVENTRTSLQDYASFILALWRPTVIGITGSVGKTSTKEAIATVLASSASTFRSWQGYNDLLGIPLSLGRLEPQHEYAVLELGCDHPGEIANLCRIVRPHTGVITHLSPTQLQYFGTYEQLVREFYYLYECIPQDGYIIQNIDSWNGGFASQPDDIKPLPGRMLDCISSDMPHIRTTWDGTTIPWRDLSAQATEAPLHLTSRLLGTHHTATMLAAYLVARFYGLQPETILPALAQVAPLPGRLNPLPGIGGARLLDDTHNAAPAAVLAGLATLDALTPKLGRRIAILGDMLNLGDYEEEAHRLIGQAAARHTDYLITRGTYAALMAEIAQKAGMPSSQVIVTSTYEDAAKAARQIVETRDRTSEISDVILIKGAEATRMERVTELLMAHPASALEKLVRQTPGWKQIVVARAERPTWVEVDLSAIGNNTRLVKELVGPQVRILVSLKADAYGHGAIKVARTVLHNGASMLGVATLSEATPLREAGIDAPILVFGYVPLWQMREAVRQGVTVTLYTIEAAQALSRTALALNKTVKVHAKIDTGMGRLGIRVEQLDEIIALVRELHTLPGLEFEGIYTHFAAADASDQSHARTQLARFQHVLQLLDEQGLRPPIVHAANSAATVSLPEAHFDMVRPGVAIYGLHPSEEVRLPDGFHAALSFKTQVAQVKMVPAGECISYGCTYITERPTRIAVLPVGYADGFRRAPTNWGTVLLHGQEAPILGRVCMDQCMIDVTHLPQTRVGDEVVLIGQQGEATLTAEQVAERLGTISYEVVAEILARVPRVD